MSFSFKVDGHAGNGVAPTDEDEGEKVKDLITSLLMDAQASNLNLTVSSVKPTKWGPENLSTYNLNASPQKEDA